MTTGLLNVSLIFKATHEVVIFSKNYSKKYSAKYLLLQLERKTKSILKSETRKVKNRNYLNEFEAI